MSALVEIDSLKWVSRSPSPDFRALVITLLTFWPYSLKTHVWKFLVDDNPLLQTCCCYSENAFEIFKLYSMVAERLRVTCEIRGNWICICHSPCDGGDLKPFEIPSRAMDHSANYHPAPNRRRIFFQNSLHVVLGKPMQLSLLQKLWSDFEIHESFLGLYMSVLVCG